MLRRHRSESPTRLRPAELAEAAILADLAVLVTVLARLSPFAGLTTVVGAIPFAVLSMRQRTRAVVVAFWIAVVLVFLLAGFGAATQVLVMATFGGVSGRAFAGGWSRRTTVMRSVAIGWGTVASLTLGFLWLFDGLRELNLEAARVQWTGLARLLDGAGLDVVVGFLDPRIDWMLEHWWITVPVFQLGISVFLTVFLDRLGRPITGRVLRSFGPVPVAPPAATVLADSLIAGTGLTVMTGPNGAGKSTLLRAVAERAGRLGEPGGTAVIGQRPESQVIGARVADDLAWGFDPAPDAASVAGALERVGLAGFESRETNSLSGGELQRLALASALLRRPSLVLSDESTAMIDPAGRATVMATLRLLADEGAVVVHATHLDAEQRFADRVLSL